MTILTEPLLLDTNVWIFGLRRDEQFPACVELLDGIGNAQTSSQGPATDYWPRLE